MIASKSQFPLLSIKKRLHVSYLHSVVDAIHHDIPRAIRLFLDSDMLANLDERLAVLVDRVFDEVGVEGDLALGVDDDDGGAAVVEGAHALPPLDGGADVDAIDVLDAADQHGADGDHGDGRATALAPQDHDAAAVLAEDVHGAALVDGLGVHGIVWLAGQSWSGRACRGNIQQPGISWTLSTVPLTGACQRW